MERCKYILGCKFASYGGAFGYCPRHYGAYHSRVKRGKTTWEEIEKQRLIGTHDAIEKIKCRTNMLYKYARARYTLMPVPYEQEVENFKKRNSTDNLTEENTGI